MSEPDAGDGLTQRMRAGVLSAVRRAGLGLKAASVPSFIGLLSAGALAPVVATGLAAGGLTAAVANLVGSVGANVLTDVVMRAMGRLRDSGNEVSAASLEQSLAVALEAVLARDDPLSAELRGEVALLFQKIDVGSITWTVGTDGDRELQEAVAVAFTNVMAQFSEFSFLLVDVRDVVRKIDERLREEERERRVDRERARADGATLRQVLHKLSVVEERTRRQGENPAPDSGWDGCPYLGLSPYDERHAEVFYGRKERTADLLQRLAEHLNGAGPLLVVGPSGAGKSSLLRAGLIPQLAADRLVPGSAHWPRRILRPTSRPLTELATHLADLAGIDAAAVKKSLEVDPQSPPLIVRQAVRAASPPPASHDAMPARLILIVDQFEDLFIDDRDPITRVEREAFIRTLEATANTANYPGGVPSALIVLSIRGDYLDQAMTYLLVQQAVEAGPFTVGPMTEEELRLAITGPGSEAKVEIETALVNTVLDELRASAVAPGFEIGALPLLSQAMFMTWGQRDGGPLTVRAYRRAGGVGGAVNAAAEQVFRKLDDDNRGDIARAVFVRLTAVTSDGRLACRRVAPADLRAAVRAPARDVDAVVEAFAQKRLITRGEDGVEISHDVLLRAWARLRDWLATDQADHVLHTELVDRANAWHAQRREPSLLYRGKQLDEVQRAVDRWSTDPDRYPTLTLQASQFLAACQRARVRAARVRGATMAAMAALTAVAVVAAGVAVHYAEGRDRSAAEADRQHAVALSRQLAAQSLAADTPPATARQLAAAAWQVAQTDEARDSLLALLVRQRGQLYGHTDSVNAVAFRPDSAVVASASSDGTVRLWDPATGRAVRAPLTGHVGAVHAVAFSPDGAIVATGGGDSTVRLWNPRTGQSDLLRGHTEAVLAIAFSPDGRMLASAGSDGTIRLWRTATREAVGKPLKGHTKAVNSVAFSPDGRQMATGSDDQTVRRWKPETREPIGSPISYPTVVRAVAYEPNKGRLLAVACGGYVVSHDLVTGEEVDGPPSGFPGGYLAVAFHGSGTMIAAANSDHSVVRWSPVNGGVHGAPLTGHTGPVNAVAFSRDGRWLATASSDRTVRLWNPGTGRPTGEPLTGHRDRVGVMRFGPGGRVLATGSDDGTAYTWDPVVGTSSLQSWHHMPVSAIAFSPDGRRLASASRNVWVIGEEPSSRRFLLPWGTVRAMTFDPQGRLTASDGGQTWWWKPNADEPAVVFLKESNYGETTPAAYTPGAGLLAVAGRDSVVRMWSPQTGDRVGAPMIGHNDTVTALAFSEDGSLLATASKDGTVRLWNSRTGAPVGAPLAAHTDEVTAVAFNAAGSLLAASGSDGTVRLWDPKTRRPVGIPLRFPQGVTAVALGPGWLAAATADHAVHVWDLARVGDPIGAVCTEFGPIDDSEWLKYAPNEPKPRLCT